LQSNIWYSFVSPEETLLKQFLLEDFRDYFMEDSVGRVIIIIMTFILALITPPALAVNRALSLDGDGDYVEMEDSEALNSISSQMTMEAWIRPTAFPENWIHILYKGDKFAEWASNRSYCLQLNSSGSIHLSSAPSGEEQVFLNSPSGLIVLNTWYHIAGIIDARSGVMRIFLNGIEVASQSFWKSIHVSALPLQIGWSHEQSHASFAGQIDEVRIWNIARTPKEIRATMFKTLRGDEIGLIGYWRFEGEDEEVIDATKNQNHGKMFGDAKLVAMELPMNPEQMVISDTLLVQAWKQLEFKTGALKLAITAQRSPMVAGLTPLTVIIEISDSANQVLFRQKHAEGEMLLWSVPDDFEGDVRIMAHQTDSAGKKRTGETIVSTRHLQTGKPSTANFKRKEFWRNYKYIDGLVDNRVTCLLEAKDGSLWVGTWSRGLSRFDGQTWMTFNKENSSVGNAISALLQTQEGKIWAGSTDEGLSYYDGSAWMKLPESEGKSVSSLLQSKDGTLWLGTTWGKTEVLGLFHYDGQTWRHITTEDGLANNVIYCLLQTQEGTLWAGTYGGLSYYDGQRWRTITPEEGFPGEWIEALFQTRDGRLWVGTYGQGLFCYDGQKWQRITTDDGLANNNVTSITQTQDGILWVGTQGGLSYYNGQSWHTLIRDDGLAGNNVLSVVQTQDGTLWVGTREGLSRCDRKQWQIFTLGSQLADNYVGTLLRAQDDSIWIGVSGSEGGGLYRYHGQSCQRFTPEDGLADDDILSLSQTRDGAIWIGTNGSGLCRYDGKQWVTFTTKDGLASDDVGAVLQTQDEKLWVCNVSWPNGGLNCYDGQNWYRLAEARTTIRSLLETRDGALWVGTLLWYSGGLMRYTSGTTADGKEWQRFTTEDGLAANNISALLQTSADVLWVGTDNGLSRYEGPLDSLDALWDKSRWTTFTEKDGLIGRMIHSLFQTEDGKLWIGTEEGGLNIYDGKCFQCINTEDGLPGNAVRSIVQAEDNALWIGTTNGIARLVPNKTPPHSTIQRVIADDARIDNPKGKIQLSGPVKYLLIEYRGITFNTRRGGLKYFTQLVGVDDVWRKPTNDERVEYVNLKPGDYTFKMQAVDRYLNYSAIANLTFTVVPPFYMRTIFLVPTVSSGTILLVTLMLLAITFVKHRRRIHAYERLAVQELQDANRVQMSLMPEVALPIDGVEVAGKCVPANTVSGDFFDYLQSKSKNEIGLVVADVTGKAMKGAMNAVLADGVLRMAAKAQEQLSPASLMAELNDVLKMSMEWGMNITMVIGVIDAESKTLTLANAAHHAYPLLLRNGEVQTFKTGGLPLGMKAGVQYTEEQLPLQTGDMLVLMTDGIIEAQDGAENYYSDSGRLEETILRFTQDMSAEAMVEAILNDAMEFGGDKAQRDDDMTVVVAKIQ